MMNNYEENPPVEALDPSVPCGITHIAKNMNGITLHLVKEVYSSYPKYTFRYYWKELSTI